MNSISTESVSIKEVKKYLNYSIFIIILGPVLVILFFLLLDFLPHISSIPSDLIFLVGIPLIMWPIILMVQGIVSLILYFINHEIMYGMWKKKEKNKEKATRNIKMGRRIQLIIVLPGVFVMVISMFMVISTLIS